MYDKKRMHAETSHVELIKTCLLILGRRQPFLLVEISFIYIKEKIPRGGEEERNVHEKLSGSIKGMHILVFKYEANIFFNDSSAFTSQNYYFS
jgi:hypothetical protein